MSNLLMGFKLYEYFPYAWELAQLEKDEPALHETYRELMRHYYIYLNLYLGRENVNSLKSWVELFVLDHGRALENLQTSVLD